MAWTEEQKSEVIEKYKKANPTPETSTEIIKEIAEELEQSPNGIRMILVQAGVYVKKESTSTSTTKTTKGEGPKRVSKEAALEGLRKALTAKNAEINEEILEKMTGKAAVYFTEVINGI